MLKMLKMLKIMKMLKMLKMDKIFPFVIYFTKHMNSCSYICTEIIYKY